jgi:signal transduction histidine kinase
VSPFVVLGFLIFCCAVLSGIFSLGWYLCSRAQSNRISAALVVSDLSKQVASISVMAANNSAAATAALGEMKALVVAHTAGVRALETVVDRLDRGQASMLNALVHSGVLQALSRERSSQERQRGEGTEQQAPPLEPPKAPPTHAGAKQR